MSPLAPREKRTGSPAAAFDELNRRIWERYLKITGDTGRRQSIALGANSLTPAGSLGKLGGVPGGKESCALLGGRP